MPAVNAKAGSGANTHLGEEGYIHQVLCAFCLLPNPIVRLKSNRKAKEKEQPVVHQTQKNKKKSPRERECIRPAHTHLSKMVLIDTHPTHTAVGEMREMDLMRENATFAVLHQSHE